MRPFCIATTGAILGIIMGLYLNSIAFFVSLFILFLMFILSLFLFPQYIKIIAILSICIVSFYSYVSILENNHKKVSQNYNKKELQVKAVVVSDKVAKEYKDVYEIKIKELNNSNTLKIKNKILLNIKRDKQKYIELQYGDEINFTAIYEKASIARNEGGFDYEQYLKTKKISGIFTIKSSDVNINGKNKIAGIEKVIHDIKKTSIQRIKDVLPEDTANLCTGLLLGEKSELSEDIQESFRKSNLSHMLAISGAHVSYILLGLTKVLQKLKLHKRWGKILLISFLLFFMALVGFTPSVTRACIMTILQLFAGVIFRKPDTYQNLAISSFIILLANPYALLDIGFQLSFGGTIGIVIFSKRLLGVNIVQQRSKEKSKNKIIQTLINTVKEMCIVTLSANLLIIPIMMYHFNTFSFTFLISNLLASQILGISLIISMIFLLTIFICIPIAKILSFLLQPILQLLITIANFSSKLPFSQILVPTPKIWQIGIYYLILYFIFCKTHVIEKKHKKLILIFLIFLIISPYFIKLIPNNKLVINFVDVGQGDCTLIKTPSNKVILTDGGRKREGQF